MKSYTKFIAYIAVLGVVVVVVIGYFMFYSMNSSLLEQQEEKFRIESMSKMRILNEQINSVTKSFKSYTQLPSFKAIRFNQLTLNQFAVEDNLRQLELFFFDMQEHNDYLVGIKLIDNSGNELIKVDRSSIRSDLGNIYHNKNVSRLIEHDLKADEFHIDIVNDTAGKPEILIWWLPVYVSSNKKMGYMAFEVKTDLISREMNNLAESDLNYAVITNESDDLLKGNYRISSGVLPDDAKHKDNVWVVSDTLPLSGINWKIHIIGNKSVYNENIDTAESIVTFALIPASLFVFILLSYVYRKKVESDKHIHHLAYYDSLTGLINRHQFDKMLNIALDETHEHNSHHALLYLDLDQFKIVNDTCGHLAGDKLLEELASHLKHSVRDSDMLARLGGDEFALLLNLCPEDMAITVANKILTAVSDFKFVWKDKSFSVGVSIGVVFITNSDETSSNVLRKADLACYMAKELGRNRIHIYTDDDQSLEKRHGEMQWVSRITQGLERDRFFLMVQRIQPLHDEDTVTQKYEVLIRLNENGKTIPPDAFIPAAERYGLMPNIDKWVIENTFLFIEKLFNTPSNQNKDIVFSINISGLTLCHKDLFPYIKDKLINHKIPPEVICFEITETAAISNLSIAMKFIHNIKELGCTLALDDFGSGLCSFTYLKTIPVDYLKIDGSFITRMLDNPLDMAIVLAIKEIGLAINTQVIAEYVSSSEIEDKLREIGIDYAQGYSIAEPVPINSLFKLVDVNGFKSGRR